jgi:hypothetical protein
MSQDTPTPEQEVNDAPETTENNEQEDNTDAEPSVADLHEEETKTEEPKEKKKVDSVPMARLNKEIQRRKDLEAELKELRGELEDDPEVEDVEANPEVQKLAERLESIEKKEKLAKREAAFQQGLSKALENAPEYKDVVNAGVIRALAFDPANANKTYKQLLEEAYGNAITGRRTVETTTPRGGAKDAKLDMKRAQTDPAYRKEVLRDPELRKQYNEGLTDRVFR